jgi:hypothetical protein
MEILQEAKDSYRKSFLSTVFSTSEEGKAEVLNVVQYATLGVIPIVVLNKLIQRFVPEADVEKSSLELLVEVFIQLIVMFCGIILIHRIIAYIPTYSGFKYESLSLTNVILAFLVIVLSIQTKLGIKVNILVDRVSELWNGPSDEKKRPSKGSRNSGSGHTASQADYLDSPITQSDLFPPAPTATAKSSNGTYDQMIRGSSNNTGISDYGSFAGPAAANSVLGGSFGSFF